MQDKFLLEIGKLYMHTINLQEMLSRLQIENKQKDEQIAALQGELDDSARKGESAK